MNDQNGIIPNLTTICNDMYIMKKKNGGGNLAYGRHGVALSIKSLSSFLLNVYSYLNLVPVFMEIVAGINVMYVISNIFFSLL